MRINYWEILCADDSFRLNLKKKSKEESPPYTMINADSFYEWKKAALTKTPFRILMKDEDLFAFAGIWDVWEKDGKTITSCSIITTTPNSLVTKIHDRMPVILPKDKEQAWLKDIKVDEALTLLKPYDPDQMQAYEISTMINNPKNETEEVIKAVGS